MDFFSQVNINSVGDISSLIDIPLKILTGVAIIVGGIWTYFNFIQGRLYYPRFEPKIDLSIISRNGVYYLRTVVHAKNVGLSRIDFKHGGSGICFREYPDMGSIDDVFSADVKEISCFDVFGNHNWIEPNEVIRDQRLIVVPRTNQVAFDASVRVVGVRHGICGSKRRFEWNADQIAFVEFDTSQPQENGGT